MKRIESTNDFVVKFANVNGSGSASANELFARAILRMGVPVSPRNIFPSNIQGLPTWYEVRVNVGFVADFGERHADHVYIVAELRFRQRLGRVVIEVGSGPHLL